MAKVKNISGVDRTVPALGGRLVVAGAAVDVPDDAVYGFTCQEQVWAPADAGAKKAHATATTTPEPEAAPSEKENA